MYTVHIDMYVRTCSLTRLTLVGCSLASPCETVCYVLGSTYIHAIYQCIRTDPLGMTDRDEALHYLLNKLKSEDGWSSSNLTWNDEKLAVISDQFSSFDGVVKAKVLLSFLSMSPRTISKVRGEGYMYVDLLECDVPLNTQTHTCNTHLQHTQYVQCMYMYM